MVSKKSNSPAVPLLSWYDRERRDLPWRSQPGEAPEPYHVWLSEVMLQQTTVATVTPRFQAFLERWPTIEALSAASLDDVLHEWQGLGYYARARNLHRCARIVALDHGGVFPGTEAGLRPLPGIGEYTAAAIAAIAFGTVAAPVDGNIIRVISRMAMLDASISVGKKQVAATVAAMMPADRPGDFAQAMMDLGAMVCTPRNPNCRDCPWVEDCRAHGAGKEEHFPVRKAKRGKPTRHGTVFWLEDAEGRILLRRRPEQGLLGGMMEFPSTDWEEARGSDDEAAQCAPQRTVKWRVLEGEVRHTFTHFHLQLGVWKGHVGEDFSPLNGYWVSPDNFGDHALPTVMKKVATHVSNADAINRRN